MVVLQIGQHDPDALTMSSAPEQSADRPTVGQALWIVVCLAVLALIVVDSVRSGVDDEPAVEASPDPSLVTEADFDARGLVWPLVVDHGTVACWPLHGGLTVEVRGDLYALNGLAVEDVADVRDLHEIWRADTSSEAARSAGLMLSALDLQDAARELC